MYRARFAAYSEAQGEIPMKAPIVHEPAETICQATSASFIEGIRLISQTFFHKAALLIPINQFSVLKLLETEKSLTMSEIGDHLHLVKQQMTPLIDKLVRMGYVKRQGRPDDRRFIDITLTEEGRSFIRECDDRLRSKIEASLSTLSDEELGAFFDCSKIIIPLLRKLSEQQPARK